MSKISYVAPFKDGTGYSQFAIDTVLSLDAAGVPVVCRNIKLANQTVLPPPRILELERENLDGITHNITHILPAYFSYQAGVKNIGLAHFETDLFRSSSWQHYCNLMDELWVSCPENKDAAIKSGVKVPIQIVGKGHDPLMYNPKNYQPLAIKGIDKAYKFYFIGDYSNRKNVHAVIKSYFEEFTKADNVVLILKTYVEGTTAQDSNNIIQQEIKNIKAGIRRGVIDDFPQVILITSYLSNEQMLQLHAMGDCFVSMEKGSAWTIPAFDAIAMGKWTILNGWGGHTQYVQDSVNGWMLPFDMEPVAGMQRCPYPNLYYGNEKWANPNTAQLGLLMREAVKQKPYSEPGTLENFSYENNGRNLKQILGI